ncbi:hypothetical protein CH330_08590 [candidate division WOR-3 bacterium JGI_Cruoil_03_51_56]|uniref:Phosphotyrosine protein phosphatase I domain-containing protein n=1 Tax=candidate division WOR-3 bacterium JGI_Cruoil_03_51_56 TaxID=1973747 RepID=A0A235BR32_UNCW3|nr:MAG: hypothetical protein CH330_08590 [candidate division WOR-3 bacterium JGI_Cruoil_03_51_56]
MKLIRLNPKRLDEIARSIDKFLKTGPGAVPLFGGYCVLSYRPGWLQKKMRAGFRLVSGPETIVDLMPDSEIGYCQRVQQVLAKSVLGIFNKKKGWAGVGLAVEPLARAILAKAQRPVGIGVPAQQEIEEINMELDGQLEFGIVAQGGSGPTVVDFSRRPVVVDRRGKLGILDLENLLGETVRLGPEVVFSVVFVCTGNSCRSPVASGLLKKMFENDRVFVYSAGTDVPEGAPATGCARQVAEEFGVDLGLHRAQSLTPGMVHNADLVLVMEKYHRERVVEMVPDAAGKTRLLCDRPIEDPIGRPLEFYRRIAAEINHCLERVAGNIRTRLGQN